ncbi:hypothetical protein [Mesorhizobium ventifaucium]|uniref:hypothetical protein n=1 Tax=Mesorhizobium ventifaucium TaxID=666020 RepID=UPI0020A6DBE8|nr:hypothetical protein [Mesorhizobium ventifaucium]
MLEINRLEVAKARQGVKRAENSLKRANELLDEDGGVAVNLALCGRIRAEQRRVIDARERLTKEDRSEQHRQRGLSWPLGRARSASLSLDKSFPLNRSPSMGLGSYIIGERIL